MTDPAIDPKTGQPAEPTGDPPEMIQVNKAEFEEMQKGFLEMKGKLDVFDRFGPSFNQQPASPAPAKGPTLADQVKEIDEQIDALDAKIDKAIEDREPVSALMRSRDTLNAQRIRMEIKHNDIDPLRDISVNSIDSLSDKVVRGGMEHFDIVKDDYNAILKQIPPEQRMTQQAKQFAYNTAVGQNFTKIFEAKKEAILRDAATQNPPDSASSKQVKDDDGDVIPKPEEVLSKSAFAALREKGQDVDSYYKSLGHKDGWAGYYKRHKNYIRENMMGGA
jgi:hypothetical protein